MKNYNCLYQKKSTGFSLLELSIVLTIIAIIAGSTLSISTAKNDQYKIKQTKNKLDLIEKTMSGFVKMNYRLPCPADQGLTPGDANYGVENCACALTSSGTAPSGFNGGSPIIAWGMIPYKVLGLTKDIVIDAWGNKIMYIVTQKFTANGGGICYSTPTTSTVDVMSSCNMGVIQVYGPGTSNVRTGSAIYGLISYGPNGYGGIGEYSFVQNLAPTSSDESNNVPANSSTSLSSFVAEEPKAGYDDIVRYKTKWQVVKEAGALIANDACGQAKTILESDETIYNGNSYNKLCGAKPSSNDCSIIANDLANLMIQNMCLRK